MTATALPPGARLIPERLREIASARPDEDAVVLVTTDGPHRSVTWAGLVAQSSQLARELAARGVVLGDRVAVQLGNGPDFVVALLAAWALGAVPVPVRGDLPDWERDRLHGAIGARAVLTDAGLPELLGAAARQPDGPLPDVVGPVLVGLCSSGSTGTPKVLQAPLPGVWLPMVSEPFVTAWGPVSRPQTVLVAGTLASGAGFGAVMSLLGGDRLVVLERFDAERLVAAVERYRVTTFHATSTVLQRVGRLPGVDARDLSSLEWVVQTGAVLAPAVGRRWCELLGPERLFVLYGMTEGYGLTAVRGDRWLQRPGTVGQGISGTQVLVLDEHGEPVPDGVVGEVHLRWPLTTPAGQGDRAGATPYERGFRSAGDLGLVDDRGDLHVVDRRVDMIVTGGLNVYAAEVEGVLGEHPSVADALVVGLSDPEWGRRVHAVVEPADPEQPPTPAEVIAFVRERLAPYKAPKTVEIVRQVPRTSTTKVDRSAWTRV